MQQPIPPSDARPASGKELASHMIASRWILFAAAAGGANILAQELVVRLQPNAPVILSALFGTAAGFLLKYVLDKYWIFFDAYDDHVVELRKIVIYGLFSVLTTAMFLAIELSAWHIFRSSLAKYAGAALGLGVGYRTKYFLDKRFVFADSRQ
jgi:putative flippase GtrA